MKMTNAEAIKYLNQLYLNGGYTWLDFQRIEAINLATEALLRERAWKEERPFNQVIVGILKSDFTHNSYKYTLLFRKDLADSYYYYDEKGDKIPFEIIEKWIKVD